MRLYSYQEAYQEFRKTARYRRLPDTRKEAEEEGKQGKRKSQAFGGDLRSLQNVIGDMMHFRCLIR